MPKVFTVLIFIIGLIFNNERIESKVLGNDKEKINWEKKGGDRSLFPISSYIKDGVVTIYFYGQPEVATITIEDNSGSIVYQNMVTDTSVVNIDLNGHSGSFTIVVGYDSELYYGKFELY